MAVTAVSANAPRARAPGVRIEAARRTGARTPELMTGVPAFIGFGGTAPYGEAAVAVVDRWNAADFALSVGPDAASFLPMAVRGFFANGGARCLVVTVPAAAGANGLVAALAKGGVLDERTDLDLVCVPDAIAPGVVAAGRSAEVHAAALAHCARLEDRFAILDAPPLDPAGGEHPVALLAPYVAALRSAFGALYFPWIASDRAEPGLALASPDWRRVRRSPAAPGPLVVGPPCGHVAGLIARVDRLVGAQRAPANFGLEDVVDTVVGLSDDDHATLNAGSVNCLRSSGRGGIEVAGARTLSGQSAWTHVSTARIIIGFRRWLAVGLRDFVFEPQSPLLWERIRLRLVAHCLDLLRVGALAGAGPGDAFFVKCDAELNGFDAADLGRVVALVGLAATVPAEFIVVRVEHDLGGATTSSLSQ